MKELIDQDFNVSDFGEGLRPLIGIYVEMFIMMASMMRKSFYKNTEHLIKVKNMDLKVDNLYSLQLYIDKDDAGLAYFEWRFEKTDNTEGGPALQSKKLNMDMNNNKYSLNELSKHTNNELAELAFYYEEELSIIRNTQLEFIKSILRINKIHDTYISGVQKIMYRF